MRILTRYVLTEMIQVFLVSLTGMTIFILLILLFKEAVNQGLGLKQIFLLIPYVLPDTLRFAVPATILFAACSVFGRLASSNEVIAVKASGITPMVLIVPVLVFAFLVSLVGVWLNDLAVSWGRDGIARVVIESVEEIAYSRLLQKGSYSSKQFQINVHRVEGNRLIGATITFQGGDDEPPKTVTCEEATMRSDLVDKTLKLICRNGTVDWGTGNWYFPETQEFSVPLDEASRKGGGNRSPSDMPMYAMPEERAAQLVCIDTLQQQMAAKASYQMIGGDFVALMGSSWKHDEQQVTEARQRLCRLEMEPYRRWALGFSCLSFAIVGAPLAIRLRNADFLTSFFLCFMPILIFYYPLLMFGVSQAKNGSIPPWSVWVGNVILVTIGWRFMQKVCRY